MAQYAFDFGKFGFGVAPAGIVVAREDSLEFRVGVLAKVGEGRTPGLDGKEGAFKVKRDESERRRFRHEWICLEGFPEADGLAPLTRLEAVISDGADDVRTA